MFNFRINLVYGLKRKYAYVGISRQTLRDTASVHKEADFLKQKAVCVCVWQNIKPNGFVVFM